MYYTDGDPISKSCMIHWQTSYNSVVVTKIQELHEVSQLIETNETLYDSVVLTKDTRVIQGLPIDGVH